MLKWFPDEDVFKTIHKHHCVVIPVTETFDVPYTTLYPRLMERYKDEVRIIQNKAAIGKSTRCCNCICTGEGGPKLIFIPCMRKNKQSGIICPDINELHKSLVKLRDCSLNLRLSIAFDRYSFFYHDFEEEVASYNVDRARLWPYVENEIRYILASNEYSSIGIFTYRKRYENPSFAQHNKSEVSNNEEYKKGGN